MDKKKEEKRKKDKNKPYLGKVIFLYKRKFNLAIYLYILKRTDIITT